MVADRCKLNAFSVLGRLLALHKPNFLTHYGDVIEPSNGTHQNTSKNFIASVVNETNSRLMDSFL
jgi:hypothetical protein